MATILFLLNVLKILVGACVLLVIGALIYLIAG